MKEKLLHEVWKPIKGYEELYEISSFSILLWNNWWRNNKSHERKNR